MHSVRVENDQSPYFAAVWRTYEASFPPAERRGRAAQAALFANPRYRLDAWLDGDVFIGLMAWWDYGDYRYVEHLAIAPEIRSGGYGGKILRAWMECARTPVSLEIEDPVDDLTRRRLGFYKRLGYLEHPGRHEQPSYQKGGLPVPMQVLSWPHPLTEAQYSRLMRALRSEVWAKPE